EGSLVVAAERHGRDHRHRPNDALERDLAAIGGDDARLLEPADALEAGAGAEVDALGEARVGDAPVALENLQDLPIDAVDRPSRALHPKELRGPLPTSEESSARSPFLATTFEPFHPRLERIGKRGSPWTRSSPTRSWLWASRPRSRWPSVMAR